MSGGYFTGAIIFVLDSVFALVIGAVLLRLLLQSVRADFYNALSQAVVKLTNPLLRPLRRYIPAIGRIDTASIALLLGLQLLNLWLAIVLSGGEGSLLGLLVMAVAALLAKVFYLYMFAILALVVASWVAPGTHNPVLELVDSLTAPLMRPIRRQLPALGGLDLSPMVALVLLQLALMLVSTPLRDFGISLL